MRRGICIMLAIGLAAGTLAGATAEERARQRIETMILLRVSEALDLPEEENEKMLASYRALRREERRYREQRAGLLARLERELGKDPSGKRVEETVSSTLRLDEEHRKRRGEALEEVLRPLSAEARARFLLAEDGINREIIQMIQEIRKSRVPGPLRK